MINILTRTSNRPNGFDINKKSIRNQNYDKIKHIVSIDNEDDNYVNQYDDIMIVKIDRKKLIENDTCVSPNTGPYSPHNLYFNEMMGKVDDGWIMFLDDDDRFLDENSLSMIVENIKDEDTLLMWQMVYSNGETIPRGNWVNTKPLISNIGSPCFMFHSKYKDNFEWDSWKCGDYRFFSKLFDTIPNKVYINKPLVFISQIGFGMKRDV